MIAKQQFYGIIENKMESKSKVKISQNTKKGNNIFAQAGKQVIKTSYSPHNILQEVGNDEQFLPITNITTTYITLDGKTFQKAPKLDQGDELNVKFQQRTNSVENVKQQRDQQYLNVAEQIRRNTKSMVKSMAKHRQQRQKKFLRGEQQELAEVQQIISEIQQVINKSLGSPKSPFKMPKEIIPHKDKRTWQKKGIHRFQQNEGLSKLEQMLLNYKFGFQKTDNADTKKEEKRSNREQKHQQKIQRNKNYNFLQKQLKQSSYQGEASKSKLKTQIPKKQQQPKLQIQDVQIIQIEWSKLPLILTPCSPENMDIFLRIRDYPQNQNFLQAITQTITKQKSYQSYSIFDSSRTVGIKEGVLLSEQDFRQIWAQEWHYDVEQEQYKDFLCQFDFQWYRALVQFSFSHSLEQILMKQIKYDTEIYLKNLAKINGGGQNDKNILKDNLSISDRIVLNRLKFVEALLNKYYEEHKKNSKKLTVVVGVVPQFGQKLEQQQSNLLKEFVTGLFVGGIYNLKNEELMAVMIPLNQARESLVERTSTNLVTMSGINLVINSNDDKIGKPKISIKRDKLKNSLIKIEVCLEGQQQMVLEVGEELHYGRRYHIEND